MIQHGNAAMNTQSLSFAARSAIASWHIHRNTSRLAREISVRDLSAVNADGLTLVDVYERKGDRRAVAALRSIGAHRTVH